MELEQERSPRSLSSTGGLDLWTKENIRTQSTASPGQPAIRIIRARENWSRRHGERRRPKNSYSRNGSSARLNRDRFRMRLARFPMASRYPRFILWWRAASTVLPHDPCLNASFTTWASVCSASACCCSRVLAALLSGGGGGTSDALVDVSGAFGRPPVPCLELSSFMPLSSCSSK